MGLAKEKLFGQRKPRWSKLQRLIEEGVLLEIDLAYAQLQVPDGSEKEAATHAALLALSRQGHLLLSNKNIPDPTLIELVTEGAFLPKNAHFEEQIVSEMHRLLSYSPQISPCFTSAKATDEQIQAIENASRYPISLITGGPGTGKTFTATQIAKMLNLKTLVTAPTGKAAAHLQSKIDHTMSPKTLHALLEVRSPLDYFKEPPSLDTQLLIVDECSMIDPPLFARLLKGISPQAKVVLMGDVNQLPAVEGGSVFADLIASEKIPTTKLTQCMRSDRREILDVATAILEGKAKDIRNLDLGFTGGDIETIYTNLWSHSKDLDFTHFRILSTLRKGPLGVNALNAFFYEKFSSLTDQFPIMIQRNDSRTGLSNGETGLLMGDKEALFSGGRKFPLHELPPYEFAYCISVHKSQGSEYDHVLLLVPEGSEAFGREVLYTAVTRAKTKLEIEGSLDQITATLQSSSRKVSGICNKLMESL